MKKSLFFLIFIVCLFIGCQKHSTIDFKEDPKHDVMNQFTYRFVGESKHFYFQTGKVFYNQNHRSLLISNFGIKEEIKGANYQVHLYFNDELLYGDSNNKNLLSKTEFENVVIAEDGTIEKDENGNIIGDADSFLKTTKETFKDRVKLEASYCSYVVCKGKNCIKPQCTTEVFNLFYLD